MQNYESIIIGAGIGGLVCGTYLAKAGLKTLIVEKHDKVGGYCTSFKRKGYRFDSAVHSLRGLREGNQLGIVFKDHGLVQDNVYRRINPSDEIILGNKKIRVYNECQESIESFISAFPNQQKQMTRDIMK